jgi:hypothetical protein
MYHGSEMKMWSGFAGCSEKIKYEAVTIVVVIELPNVRFVISSLQFQFYYFKQSLKLFFNGSFYLLPKKERNFISVTCYDKVKL